MVRRKIIKQANQAHTITLPIEWVRQNNLDKKNSEVELSIQDKSLIITNTGHVSIKKAKLNIETVQNTEKRGLWNKFNALYAQGVDEIEVNCRQEISSVIVEAINQDIGYALISHNGDTYIVKDLGGGNYSDIDEIFKRVFQMVLMFYDSAITDIFGKEKETQESLDKRDAEINRFCLYLQRAINKMSYSDQIKGRVLFTYSFALEKIGDEILRLWRTNIEHKVKKTAKIKEIVDLSRKGLDLVFDFYYAFNPDLAQQIHNLKEKARRIALTIDKMDGATSKFLHYAIQIIEDSADLNLLNLMKGL